jgi:hypothetical protein
MDTGLKAVLCLSFVSPYDAERAVRSAWTDATRG